MGQEGSTSVMSIGSQTRCSFPGLVFSTHFSLFTDHGYNFCHLYSHCGFSTVRPLFFHPFGITDFTWQFFMPVLLSLKYCKFYFKYNWKLWLLLGAGKNTFISFVTVELKVPSTICEKEIVSCLHNALQSSDPIYKSDHYSMTHHTGINAI